MKIAVIVAAGFIGSHLCEALLADEHSVLGIDALTEAYPRPHKLANIAACLDNPRFAFHGTM